jgi:XTP/dITP diphosphohydrolase
MGWRTIAFATANKHKIMEVNTILRQCGYQAEPADAPKVEIQSDNLEDIAVHAASVAWSILHKPVMVEDAGLFIEALSGFPGPYSSYVFKTIGIRGILKLMEGVENRRARFVSVIALAHASGIVVFRGESVGTIASEARGSGGFGFDPIFVPEGSTKTFAEMSVEEKSMYSHRGQAARKLCEWLKAHKL